ncbi:putative SET domain-containing protein 4-like isoform X2 [Apostichopus japonicus]|uniref:Putative SET domain-containing protein 4-like isoform X2 n=1 Tax=Stichopus japonicus TaxID=307972 RepID=A0A2G8K0G8_STIJA|nr:putative SET domain-containing protein 4-like isoform X2 [Apostichopus japonicus]
MHDHYTGRGLMATKSIKPGDVIVSIPSNLLITSQVVLRSELKDVLKIFPVKLTARLLLCAFVIYERQKGPSSFWAPYIGCLPDAFSTPSYFTSEELQHLPAALRQRATEQTRLLCDGFSKLTKFFEFGQECHFLSDFSFDLDDFKWAWSAVNTRTLYYKVEEAGSHHLVDPSERDVYVLAPFLDLLNHSSTAEVAGSFNSIKQCYEIQTTTPYNKFDQVFIHYGPHDNETLLLEYGFVEPTNPHSVVAITKEDVIKFSSEVMDAWVSETGSVLPKRFERIEAKGIWDISCSLNGPSWHLTVSLNILCMGQEQYGRGEWVGLLGGEEPSQECLARSRRAVQNILCNYLAKAVTSSQEVLSIKSDSYHHYMTVQLMQEKKFILEECLKQVQQFEPQEQT